MRIERNVEGAEVGEEIIEGSKIGYWYWLKCTNRKKPLKVASCKPEKKLFG